MVAGVVVLVVIRGVVNERREAKAKRREDNMIKTKERTQTEREREGRRGGRGGGVREWVITLKDINLLVNYNPALPPSIPISPSLPHLTQRSSQSDSPCSPSQNPRRQRP
jgi:hypothetical protein